MNNHLNPAKGQPLMDKDQLTIEEMEVIISRFRSSTVKLKASGDYPEQENDKIIMKKLLNILYARRKRNEYI